MYNFRRFRAFVLVADGGRNAYMYLVYENGIKTLSRERVSLAEIFQDYFFAIVDHRIIALFDIARPSAGAEVKSLLADSCSTLPLVARNEIGQTFTLQVLNLI